jgi:cytochrome c oxidase cbb3-type subunit 2
MSTTRALVLAACALAGTFTYGAVRSRAAQPASFTRTGQQVYDAHCVECHGTTGRGDGPAAHLLTPRPRDFTTARYKIRSTESGNLPTDDDLLRSVRQGLYGTAMPGWQTILPDTDLRAVVDYVKNFSPRFKTETPTPIVLGPTPASTPASVTRGAAVYETLQCGKCHGADGAGTGAVATRFEDDWGWPLHASNLTEPWTFHGGATSPDVFMRFRAGMSGTPMPSFKDTTSDAQMWDLANYVVSLSRKPVWEMNAAEVAAFYAQQDAEARAHPEKRGEYLVETLACAICHSPADDGKRLIPGLYLAGGLRMRIEPFGDFPTGNLTSDKETGLGNWTDAEIKQTITRGILRDGTRLLPYPMDWASFSTMPSTDIDAIVAYLRTVPPVHNKVPPPSRPILPVYLWGKFQMLILGNDPPITFFAGNAGSTGAAR